MNFELETPMRRLILLAAVVSISIVAPHARAWTDELFANIARTAIGAILAVHNGRRPQFLVNPEALSHPRTKSWLR